MTKDKFAHYIAAFYHPDFDPVYPFEGLSMDHIYEAIDIMLGDYQGEIIGDSADREYIAYILTTQFGYSYPPAPITL